MANSILATILGRVLGVLFLASGARKLYGWEQARNSYLEIHPLWVYYVSAVVESIAGVGLLFSSTRFAAVVLQLSLIAGVSLHPWKHKAIDATFVIPAVVAAVLLLGVAWLGD